MESHTDPTPMSLRNGKLEIQGNNRGQGDLVSRTPHSGAFGLVAFLRAARPIYISTRQRFSARPMKPTREVLAPS